MDVLSAVLGVQSRNIALSAEELVSAARQVSVLVNVENLSAVPLDRTGDKIVGAGIARGIHLNMADTTRRLDNEQVLLVSGEIAGSAGISIRASTLRSLGAKRVDAAVLGGWSEPIEGCNRLWDISPTRKPDLKAI